MLRDHKRDGAPMSVVVFILLIAFKQVVCPFWQNKNDPKLRNN